MEVHVDPDKPSVPRWIVVALGVAVVGMLVWMLRGVLTPVFFAFLIAYMLDPVVDRLEGWRVPRGLGIVLILLVFLGTLALFLLLVVPGIIRDVAAFARELPGAARRSLESWAPVLESYDIPVPHSFAEAFESFSDDAQGMAQRAVEPAAAAVRWIVGGTASFIGAVVGLFVIPVFAFYLLYDFDRMMATGHAILPWRHREPALEIAREVDDVLGQFIRGQLLVMLCLAILYSVGYAVVGVRLAIPIGILAGLLSFIPYVGGAAALIMALAMCAFDFQGWHQIVAVCVVYGVVQALEGFVITPKIVGDKVGLSAIWVLFALMAFGELFGFLGILLAVPAAAVMKIFIVRGLARYRETEMFLAGAGTAPLVVESPEVPVVAVELPDALEEVDEEVSLAAPLAEATVVPNEDEDESGNESEIEDEGESESEAEDDRKSEYEAESENEVPDEGRLSEPPV